MFGHSTSLHTWFIEFLLNHIRKEFANSVPLVVTAYCSFRTSLLLIHFSLLIFLLVFALSLFQSLRSTARIGSQEKCDDRNVFFLPHCRSVGFLIGITWLTIGLEIKACGKAGILELSAPRSWGHWIRWDYSCTNHFILLSLLFLRLRSSKLDKDKSLHL